MPGWRGSQEVEEGAGGMGWRGGEGVPCSHSSALSTSFLTREAG